MKRGGEEAEWTAIARTGAVVVSHKNTEHKKGTTCFKIRFTGLPVEKQWKGKRDSAKEERRERKTRKETQQVTRTHRRRS